MGTNVVMTFPVDRLGAAFALNFLLDEAPRIMGIPGDIEVNVVPRLKATDSIWI